MKNYKDYLPSEYQDYLPTKEMFDAMARQVNDDGVPCLSFEDWKNFQG